MKKVTVILATYNGGETIGETIASIKGQKGAGEQFELEIIVVDDCSTDNTVEIVKDCGVQLYSNAQNSGGPNKGRNVGLTHATGDCICIADQDDIWHAHRIQTVLPYLEKVPVVSAGYTVRDVTDGREEIRVKQTGTDHIQYPKNETFLNKLTKSNAGQNTYLGTIIYSAKLKDIHFEEHFGVVDYDWILRIFHEQASIEVCDTLYTRLVDGANLSLNEGYRRKDFEYSLMFIKGYEEAYPKEVKIGHKRIHGSLARYYYLIDKMSKARYYFLRSGFSLKMLAYFCTTFIGSKFVKKKFNVFG